MRLLVAFSLALVLPMPGLAQQPPKLDVPADVIADTDVEYANHGEPLKLDLVRPKDAKGPLPVIICIHGGGFRAGNRYGYRPLCIKLAQHGYAAATISYRLAPKYQFPAAIFDCKAAVRFLKWNAEKYGLDQARVGVTGSSAGGHLAQFLGVTANVAEFDPGIPPSTGGIRAVPTTGVRCVVNVYGPSDFTKSYGKSVDAAEVLPLWLGGNLETARAKHIRASPLNWVTPNAAPTLCIHGTEDKYVAHEQAVWLVDRLKACGVEAELLTLEGAGHGFKGADAEKAEKALVAWFDKHLKN